MKFTSATKLKVEFRGFATQQFLVDPEKYTENSTISGKFQAKNILKL